jgi:hypothetical protein
MRGQQFQMCGDVGSKVTLCVIKFNFRPSVWHIYHISDPCLPRTCQSVASVQLYTIICFETCVVITMAALLRHNSKVLLVDDLVHLKLRLGDHGRLYVINSYYCCSCKCHLDDHYHGKLHVIIARWMTYRNVLGVREEGQTRRCF